MAKLTNKELEAIKPTPGKSQKVREDGGMVGFVRPRVDGSVSVYWTWRYRFSGKVRQVARGTWPNVTMPTIRKERDRLAAILAAGRDPADAEKVAKIQARAEQLEKLAQEQARVVDALALSSRLTVKELFDLWERRRLCNHKDKGAAVRAAFQRDVFGQIGDMPIEEVRRTHIATMVEKILERGVGRTAKQVLALVRQMFRYAVEEEILEADPTATIRKAKISKDVERDRTLAEAEVTALYKAMDGAKLALPTRLALLIQLATACRIGELVQAQWADIDLEAATWRIPADVAKNGREHTVYLSAFASSQFKALRAITGTVKDGDEERPGIWAFPAKQADGPVCVKTIGKQVYDRQRGERGAMSNRSPMVKALILPGGKWTPHDLRRTAATIMVSLGVLPDIVERCLNHVEENRMKRTYQRHSYAAEMKQAWKLLGERLELLTIKAGSRVVTLSERRASKAAK
jgi:integrase